MRTRTGTFDEVIGGCPDDSVFLMQHALYAPYLHLNRYQQQVLFYSFTPNVASATATPTSSPFASSANSVLPPVARAIPLLLRYDILLKFGSISPCAVAATRPRGSAAVHHGTMSAFNSEIQYHLTT